MQRRMISEEELHMGEVDKMLRKEGDIEPFQQKLAKAKFELFVEDFVTASLCDISLSLEAKYLNLLDVLAAKSFI